MRNLLVWVFAILLLLTTHLRAADISAISVSEEGYSFEVDLKKIDNNPENVNLTFLSNGNLIVVGRHFKNKSFYQDSKEFELKLPVDKEAVAKERVGSFLRIKIPFSAEVTDGQKQGLIVQHSLDERKKLKLAAMGDVVEGVDGYRISVDLSLFGDDLQNVDVRFSDEGVELFELGENVEELVSKSYILYRPFDRNGAVKQVSDNVVTVFIPFPENDNLNREDNTQELMALHEQYKSVLDMGIKYNIKAQYASQEIEALVYQMGHFSKIVTPNDSFIICGIAAEGDDFQIIRYESATNEAALLKNLDADVCNILPTKYRYLENKEELVAFSKRDDVEEYALHCTIYTKKDLKGVRRVCINKDTGIVLLNEEEGVFKVEVSDIEFGGISNDVFKIPPNAKLKGFSI